jgi:hypothetical protein
MRRFVYSMRLLKIVTHCHRATINVFEWAIL